MTVKQKIRIQERKIVRDHILSFPRDVTSVFDQNIWMDPDDLWGPSERQHDPRNASAQDRSNF